MRKSRGVLRLRHDDFQIRVEAGKVIWIAGNQTAVLDGKRSNSFKKGDIADYGVWFWPAGCVNLYGFCHKVEHGTAADSWLAEPWQRRMSVPCGAERVA